MPLSVYVLESEPSGRLYIGQTNDLDRRLREHRGGQVPSTRKRGPWRVLHVWTVETRKEAVRLERELKAMKRPDRVRSAIDAAKE